MNRAVALHSLPESPAFPGLPSIVDGSDAVAHVETRISEGCCAYPITPSTTMATLFQAAVADGRSNLWGTPLVFLEPESEHSSASAAEGFALAGGRVTNFTAGQGLVLMKEVLHVISGKRLPIVFRVGARALTSQAASVSGSASRRWPPLAASYAVFLVGGWIVASLALVRSPRAPAEED